MAQPIASGDIVEGYPYLWRWQRDRGETAGRKIRPVCVVLAVRGKDGYTHLALLPISTQAPEKDQAALELPAQERKRAGLSTKTRLWIYVSRIQLRRA
jgi:hypothetical protein